MFPAEKYANFVAKITRISGDCAFLSSPRGAVCMAYTCLPDVLLGVALRILFRQGDDLIVTAVGSAERRNSRMTAIEAELPDMRGNLTTNGHHLGIVVQKSFGRKYANIWCQGLGMVRLRNSDCINFEFFDKLRQGDRVRFYLADAKHPRDVHAVDITLVGEHLRVDNSESNVANSTFSAGTHVVKKEPLSVATDLIDLDLPLHYNAVSRSGHYVHFASEALESDSLQPETSDYGSFAHPIVDKDLWFRYYSPILESSEIDSALEQSSLTGHPDIAVPPQANFDDGHVGCSQSQSFIENELSELFRNYEHSVGNEATSLPQLLNPSPSTENQSESLGSTTAIDGTFSGNDFRSIETLIMQTAFSDPAVCALLEQKKDVIIRMLQHLFEDELVFAIICQKYQHLILQKIRDIA